MTGSGDMSKRAWVAEAIGTFALVFCGTGAIISNEASGGLVTHVGISLSFGLTVLAMIYAIGDASGAHINPAVTFGFWIAGRLRGKYVLPYVVSQCGGAVLASLCLWVVFPQTGTLGQTVPSVVSAKAFTIEVILTFFLIFVIIHVATGAREKGIMAGIAVGSVVALESLFAGSVTGASMNPARSLGPALVAQDLGHLWIYLTAPFVGAVLAVLMCKVIMGGECCKEGDS
jgi:aquaporin Z